MLGSRFAFGAAILLMASRAELEKRVLANSRREGDIAAARLDAESEARVWPVTGAMGAALFWLLCHRVVFSWPLGDGEAALPGNVPGVDYSSKPMRRLFEPQRLVAIAGHGDFAQDVLLAALAFRLTFSLAQRLSTIGIQVASYMAKKILFYLPALVVGWLVLAAVNPVQAAVCREWGLYNLVYINNYIGPQPASRLGCLPASWLLAVDVQLSLATCFIVAWLHGTVLTQAWANGPIRKRRAADEEDDEEDEAGRMAAPIVGVHVKATVLAMVLYLMAVVARASSLTTHAEAIGTWSEQVPAADVLAPLLYHVTHTRLGPFVLGIGGAFALEFLPRRLGMDGRPAGPRSSPGTGSQWLSYAHLRSRIIYYPFHLFAFFALWLIIVLGSQSPASIDSGYSPAAAPDLRFALLTLGRCIVGLVSVYAFFMMMAGRLRWLALVLGNRVFVAIANGLPWYVVLTPTLVPLATPRFVDLARPLLLRIMSDRSAQTVLFPLCCVVLMAALMAFVAVARYATEHQLKRLKRSAAGSRAAEAPADIAVAKKRQ